MMTKTSKPTNPKHKKCAHVNLKNEEIKATYKALGRDNKYSDVFRIIAENPGILTHEICGVVGCNNVPDRAFNANSHLLKMGKPYFLMCVEPANLPRNGNSHHWFVFTDSASSANDLEVAL